MSAEVVNKYHCNNYGRDMSAREGVESPTSSELPSMPTGSMAYEELEYKYNKLRKDNHQLQLRILGVNELARLLQDRNEVVAMLKEKNKRLDVSVVRLENRCANFERQIKSQKSNGVATAKPGQSPFIPGPSKQILQSLWQENEELKKTVNNLQKKGSSGYLEAIVSSVVGGRRGWVGRCATFYTLI